ncbi:MAG: LysE family translocator [Rhodospirillales bacterium]|nr:LysE family translocator [Rhodospirillales bacterium]
MLLPIDPTLWTAFVVAATLLAIMPGPVVTLVVANSLTYGSRSGLLNILGTTIGNTILLLVGAMGMAWILAAMAQWFDIIRLAGAAYLIYLGIRQWCEKAHGLEEHPEAKRGQSLFWQGFVVAVTNPKTIVFYAAFFPHFMNPELAAADQVIILSATFLIIMTTVDVSYALLAGRLRPWLTGERRGRMRNKITGTLLIGTGIALALTR